MTPIMLAVREREVRLAREDEKRKRWENNKTRGWGDWSLGGLLWRACKYVTKLPKGSNANNYSM